MAAAQYGGTNAQTDYLNASAHEVANAGVELTVTLPGGESIFGSNSLMGGTIKVYEAVQPEGEAYGAFTEITAAAAEITTVGGNQIINLGNKSLADLSNYKYQVKIVDRFGNESDASVDSDVLLAKTSIPTFELRASTLYDDDVLTHALAEASHTFTLDTFG